MIDKLKKQILEEINESKATRNELLKIVNEAEEIGYATQFALDTDEGTARSAFKVGYDLGTQDGYIDCLQKIYMILEEG